MNSSRITRSTRVVTTAYNGDTTVVTPPTGLGKTRTTLDTRGNTTKVELLDTNGTTELDSATYSYDTLNQLVALTKTYGGLTANQTQMWSWTYDWLGRETRSVDPDTGITDTAYLGDDATTITRTAHAAPATVLAKTRTDYDGLGRPTKRYNLTTSSVLETANQIANWTYDSATLGKGYLAEAASKTSLGVFTDVVTAYDKLGNPTALTSAYPAALTGQTGTRTSSATSPWAMGSNDQAVVATTQAYNLAGDPTTTTYPTITTTGSGSAAGSGAVKMPKTEVTASYTDDQRISSIQAVLRNTSDAEIRRVDVGKWAYNNIALPRTITSQSHVADGTAILERTYTWNDANGWLDQIRAKSTTGANPYLKLDYTHNTNTSQITRIDRTSTTNPTNAGTSEVSCYTYDALARLTRAVDTTNDATDHCETNVGNGGGGTTATYDYAYTYNQDRLATITTGAASSKTTSTYTYATAAAGNTATVPVHQLTSATNSSDTSPIPASDTTALPTPMTQDWDGLGRVTKTTIPVPGSPSRYSTNTYDSLGNLTTVTENDGAKDTRTTTNAYDTDGIRLARQSVTDPTNTTSKTTNTVVYLANGLELEAISTGSGTATLTAVRNTYTGPDGNPLASQDGTDFTWLIGDHLNTTRATLTNNSAATVKLLNYGPYGQPVAGGQLGTPGQRGYLNKPHDPNGDIRLNHRTYNPTTGAFTTPDPILITSDPRSLNPYAYSHFNPINLADPSGLSPDQPGEDAMDAGEHHQDANKDRVQSGQSPLPTVPSAVSSPGDGRQAANFVDPALGQLLLIPMMVTEPEPPQRSYADSPSVNDLLAAYGLIPTGISATVDFALIYSSAQVRHWQKFLHAWQKSALKSRNPARAFPIAASSKHNNLARNLRRAGVAGTLLTVASIAQQEFDASNSTSEGLIRTVIRGGLTLGGAQGGVVTGTAAGGFCGWAAVGCAPVFAGVLGTGGAVAGNWLGGRINEFLY